MHQGFDAYHQWLGIPPQEQPPQHYRLLGLTLFEDNRSVIANAAERQSMLVRTYQMGQFADAANVLLREISTAKVCLLDEAKKADYDQRLSRQLNEQRQSKKARSKARRSQKVAAEPGADGHRGAASAAADATNTAAPAVSERPPAAPEAFDFATPSPSPRTKAVSLKSRRRKSAQAFAVGAGALSVAGLAVLFVVLYQDQGGFAVAPKLEISPFRSSEYTVPAGGGALRMRIRLDNADYWKGRVRFTLPDAPLGAEIDPDTGLLTYRPLPAWTGNRVPINIRVEERRENGKFDTARIWINVR